MPKVTVDFETRSSADLKKIGAYEYSMDPSTVATCLGFKSELEGKTYLLNFQFMQKHWRELPQAFKDKWTAWIESEFFVFSAHNAFFEQCIYKNVLVRRLGWPFIPDQKWRCTAAKAAAVAIPRNLDGAGQVMNLRIQKSYEGHRIMLKLCKPRKAHSDWKKKFDKLLVLGRTKDEALDICGAEPAEFWEPETAPEDFKGLYRYCVIDVKAEELLDQALPELTPFEQTLWLVDQRINFRGVAVDMPVVNKISHIMARETRVLGKELDGLTLGLVSSGQARNAILDFLTIEGLELPDLKAKTVDDFLANGKATGDAKKLLEIRRALSKASTAKYQKFQMCAFSDGRVRDLFLYCAASTGRWGGRNVQPQNFPRGIIKDIDEAIERIKTCTLDELKLLYGENLMPLFSSVLRGMFIATKGKELFVEDYNAIETRVLWWLAGYEKGLDIFRNGRDPYKEMAAAIFKKSVLEVTDEERQVGKAAVLGCFEKNTKVVTKTGIKRICDITSEDFLWDGVEWVQSKGAIYQGEKRVMFWRGIGVTPDHQFLTPVGWASAQAVAQESTEFHKSMTELVNLPSSVTTSARAAGSMPLGLVVIAARKITRFTFQILERPAQLGAILAQKLNPLKLGKSFFGTPISFKMTGIVKDYLTEFQRFLADVKIKTTLILSTMAGGELRFSHHGGRTEEPFYDISLYWWAGMFRLSNSTESMLTRVMNRVICALLLGRKTLVTCAAFQYFKNKLINKTKLLPTYDVAYCGPRNRFTILTDAGPMIVHNCGYQMGWKKFITAAWDVYRAKVDEDLAKLAVSIYRELHFPVTELWENYNTACILAVENPGKAYKVGAVKFFVLNSFLWAELPSGRRLAYKDPSIEMAPTIVLVKGKETVYASNLSMLREALENGFVKKSEFQSKRLKYFAINHKAKKEDCPIPGVKWTRETTYGGKLTENIVQAVSRDLLAEAIVRAEKSGFEVLMHSHDELVCEAPKGTKTEKEYKQVMSTLPAWAKGLPLKTGGWIGNRYKKG